MLTELLYWVKQERENELKCLKLKMVRRWVIIWDYVTLVKRRVGIAHPTLELDLEVP